MNNLADDIKSVISSSIADKQVLDRFLDRLAEGNLTRDENPTSHFCVYFLPINKESKKIFIVHHKKSGLWLSPGGHIDKDENLLQILNREIFEELGVKDKIKSDIRPFFLTITLINNPPRLCKEHLDIWFSIPMNENEMNIDFSEFHDARWLTFKETRKLVTDKQNIEAFGKIEQLLINDPSKI